MRFVRGVLRALRRGAGLVFAWIAWPFLATRGWYSGRSWIIKGPLLAIVVLFAGLYGYFFWQTQVWTGFDPNFVDEYRFSERTVPAGHELAATAPSPDAPAGAATALQCQSSAIVDVVADLTDLNVNDNAWIQSMLLDQKMDGKGKHWAVLCECDS